MVNSMVLITLTSFWAVLKTHRQGKIVIHKKMAWIFNHFKSFWTTISFSCRPIQALAQRSIHYLSSSVSMQSTAKSFSRLANIIIVISYNLCILKTVNFCSVFIQTVFVVARNLIKHIWCMKY